MGFPRRILLKWLLTITALAIVLGGAYVIHFLVRSEREREAGGDEVKSPRRVKAGNVVFTEEDRKRQEIEEAKAVAVEWREPFTAYGRIVPNSRATHVMQAPFAGTLRADDKQPWPNLGNTVKAGQVLGHLQVRISPQEQLDWQSKLEEAKLKAKGAEQIVSLRQDRVTRLEKVSDGGPFIAQKDLDDARVTLADATTTLESAQAALTLWQRALGNAEKTGSTGKPWSIPLVSTADGEVVEAEGRPGTAIEAGGVVTRIVDFHHPLVEMDLPLDAVVEDGPPKTIDAWLLSATPGIVSTASDSRLTLSLVGPSPRVDAASQLSSYWYEGTIAMDALPALAATWRPGRFVTASIAQGRAEPQAAIAVPATALLVHAGRLCVYVREKPDHYERREVQLLGREGEMCILSGGVEDGDFVVVRNAQVLLSEEFRPTEDD